MCILKYHLKLAVYTYSSYHFDFVRCVGVSDSQSLDCEFLVRENLQLKGEMETWRNVQEVLLRENSLLKEKVKALEEEMQMNPVCQLKETAEHLERSSKNEVRRYVNSVTMVLETQTSAHCS